MSEDVGEQRSAINEFIAAATEFREVYEGAERLGCEDFLSGLSTALPRLQAAAARLPDVDPVLDHPVFELGEKERVGSPGAVWDFLHVIDWSPIQNELHEHNGGCKSLAATPFYVWDDLDDVYHDVKEGFDIMDAGFPELEAVWEWRFSFWSHWGYHAAEAQRVIHYYVALYLN